MELEIIEDKGDCSGNGLVFRCTVNTYFSKHNSIEQRKSLRLLKRDSCDCYKCTWPIEELLPEEIANNEKLFDGLEMNKKYKLVISGGYDYEYGYDIDDVYFSEVK